MVIDVQTTRHVDCASLLLKNGISCRHHNSTTADHHCVDDTAEREAMMRSELRLSDLKNRERTNSRLMNVKIPAYVSDAIQKVADDLGASKTEVVIALLNEGLSVATGALKGWRPPKLTVKPPKKVCTVKGCKRAFVAKGYCANHYQAARRGQLPLPA